MPRDTNAVRAYFSKLGLEPEIADIYLALHAYGPQSISQLARHSGVERTRIYRLLDSLTSSGLIETETHYKRTILRAAPVTNLQILLAKKEQELRNLQSELDQIHRTLNNTVIESPVTRVQFYRGLEGNKQMFWNQTRAKGETLSILYEGMQNRTSLTYFERWVRKINEQELTFRGIIGDNLIRNMQTWYKAHSNERIKNWQARYVPEEVFTITHSCITYDNVISHYNWKDGEAFGVEIYNSEIAAAQRQFFEMLWEKGVPVTNDLAWQLNERNQT